MGKNADDTGSDIEHDINTNNKNNKKKLIITLISLTVMGIIGTSGYKGYKIIDKYNKEKESEIELSNGHKVKLKESKEIDKSILQGDYFPAEDTTLKEIATKYQIPEKYILYVNKDYKTIDSKVNAGTRIVLPSSEETETIDKKTGEKIKTKSYKKIDEKIEQQEKLDNNAIAILKGKTIINPLQGELVITSDFGMRYSPIYLKDMFHDGIDLRAATGTYCYATVSGKIKYAGWYGGYGKLIIIEDENGFTYLFGHLSKIDKGIKEGTDVFYGDKIGETGNTGRSIYPHLHYQVNDNNNNPVNPTNFIQNFKYKAVKDKKITNQNISEKGENTTNSSVKISHFIKDEKDSVIGILDIENKTYHIL